jgi:hypothetical protein
VYALVPEEQNGCVVFEERKESVFR